MFGFGLFDPSNLRYKAYLDRFAKLCISKKIDVAVLCGGRTNLKFPDKSEASTLADYLKPFLGDKTRIVTEERSRTSAESVQFSKEHIGLSPENKIFVVTDSVRFFCIYWLVLHYWFGLSKNEISSEYLKMVKEAYGNPKKKSINLEMKDIKRSLKYKNVKIVIDPLHKNYKDAFHELLSQTIRLEGLYDQKIMDDFIEQARVKEEARAKFGLK